MFLYRTKLFLWNGWTRMGSSLWNIWALGVAIDVHMVEISKFVCLSEWLLLFIKLSFFFFYRSCWNSLKKSLIKNEHFIVCLKVNIKLTFPSTTKSLSSMPSKLPHKPKTSFLKISGTTTSTDWSLSNITRSPKKYKMLKTLYKWY